MKVVTTLVFYLFIAQILYANVLPPNSCDTLISKTGVTYFVNIVSETESVIRFTKCDDTDKKVYKIPRSILQEVRRQGLPAWIAPSDTVAEKTNIMLPSDTCDVLTFTDGHKEYVHIIRQDMLNYFYTTCDGNDGKVHMINQSRIRTTRRRKIDPNTGQADKTNSGRGCLTVLLIVVGVIAGIFVFGALISILLA